jgi:hypothetical protein
MGQVYSHLSASRRHDGRPPPSLFLQLPADIVLLLCRDYLAAESTLALSLTCRGLFGFAFRDAVMRLEGDPSNREGMSHSNDLKDSLMGISQRYLT